MWTRATAELSHPELEGNRIVLNATKQAPAPQAPKILGRASQPKEAWKQGRGLFRPSLSLARANSLSTTSIRPEGHCQALAELVVTRGGCWLLGKPDEGAHHLGPRRRALCALFLVVAMPRKIRYPVRACASSPEISWGGRWPWPWGPA
jgi:hypothetical protein